jgi:putative transposase
VELFDRGYSYRAYPTGGQVKQLSRQFGCGRVVYNDCLKARDEAYERGERLSYADLDQLVITQAKQTPYRAWLNEVSTTPLQQEVRHAHRAFEQWWKSLQGKRKRPVGRPRFKSKRNHKQSATFTRNSFKLTHAPGAKWGYVYLAKVGKIKFRWSRDLPSEPTSVTITRKADGHYQVSFRCQREARLSPAPQHQLAGIDVGTAHLASVVTSDGQRWRVDNPKPLKGRLRKLARLQRQLARKKKGSKNQTKARIKVARQHQKIANIRTDYLTQQARHLVDDTQVIGVENLEIASLVSHDKGRKKRNKNRTLHDTGLGMFLTTLTWMSEEAGRQLVSVNPRNTTKKCSCCGLVNPDKLDVHIRHWTCAGCGEHLDRDFNAAVNLMVAAGQAETLNACGEDVRRLLASASGATLNEAGTHRTELTHG